MATPIAALDLGTTKTCALIAELMEDGKSLRVLGAGIAPSVGMKKGVVTDVKESGEAIRQAVEQAERAARLTIQGAYVGIAGSHIQSTNSRGVTPMKDSRGVTQDDVHRALQAAEAVAVPTNREIIHSIPRGYMLDGQDGIQDPVGMAGFRLEVEAHIVTGNAPSIQNLLKAVAESGLSTIELVLQPIAAGKAVLTPEEREMGVVLVDIGGGTTDIATFIEGSVWHTVVIPTGGMHVTNDLAYGLRAPFAAAEKLKLEYGHVDPSAIESDQKIELAAFGEEGKTQVSRRHVAEIIRARMEEILHLVRTEVKRSGYDNLLAAGIVLCGGTAELPGMTAFAREVLQMPVRLGAPQDLQGFSDRVSRPAFATSVGLARWGLEQVGGTAPKIIARREKQKGNPGGGVLGWAKALLPEDEK